MEKGLTGVLDRLREQLQDAAEFIALRIDLAEYARVT